MKTMKSRSEALFLGLLFASTVLLRWHVVWGVSLSRGETPSQRKLKLMQQRIADQLKDTAKERSARFDQPYRNHFTKEDKGGERVLQQFDPCTSDASSAIFLFSGLVWWYPSFFETCATSINVDDYAMSLHLQSLREIFEQYQ